MTKYDNNKLMIKLCELKLEQRHINTDMSKLIKGQKTVDFFQARKLNTLKTDLSKKISKVQSIIDPNIIA